MSPYCRRPAPAPVREPHVRPSLRHMTTNLPQLRLPARASPGRSPVSAGPLRAVPAGSLPGRLSALGQRPLGAPTRTPREPAAPGTHPPAGPEVSNYAFPTRDRRPEPASRPSAAAVTLRPTEGPAVAPARPWCRRESRPSGSGLSSSSGPCRLLGP